LTLSMTGGARANDPLVPDCSDLFEGVDAVSAKANAGPPKLAAPCRLRERLKRRINRRGERNGALRADLELALGRAVRLGRSSMRSCSTAMKTVGELFGSGQMQLPFVLQFGGRLMKARGRLPRNRTWRSRRTGGRGTIVLATVRGDVHGHRQETSSTSILSNNGYDVVNIGIKQPILRDHRGGRREHRA